MNLKMKTLAAAVIATAAMSTASANSLLFPYYTTANGAQSVISLASSPVAPAASFPNGNNIHYVYNYGPSCAHYDGFGSMTPGDLLQHSIADKAAGGFGLVTGSDKSKPFFFPLQTDGFLTVTNTTTANTVGTTTTTPDLTGSMVVADPTSGLMVTYKAISNTSASEGDFSNITDTAFTLSWYPDAIANTAWYAVVAGNMSGAITSNSNWQGAVQWGNGGVVRDNDEAAFSGTSGDIIACRGIIPRDSGGMGSLDVGTLVGLPFPFSIPVPIGGIMTDAQQAAINNGGVARVGFSTINGASGVVLAKIETVLPAVGAPFAGKTLMHIENNLTVGKN